MEVTTNLTTTEKTHAGRSTAEIFENKELGFKVRTMLNPDGSISVNAEDTAIGFGWTQTQVKNGREYTSVRWERMSSFSADCGFPHEWGKDDYIPESLFYMLGFKAGNERALKFQKWLAVEVLPSIRKNGGYISGQETMSDDELLAKALMVAQNKIAERDKAINQLKTEVDVKNQMIGELKPKAEFFDAVADSKDAIEIGKVAKVLNYPGIGRNKLFEILRQNGILMRNNIPYQKYIDNGCFRTVEQKYSMPDGEIRVSIKTLVYQRGVEHIRRVLKS